MHKEIKTDFVNKQVSVRVPMNSYYKLFMDTITIVSGSAEDRFVAGVQCIIWGSLFVEALVNIEVERHFSSSGYHSDSPEAKRRRLMWDIVERADLEKKLQVLALAYEGDEVVADAHQKQLKRLTRVRNRLVHYKEEEKMFEDGFMDKPSHIIMGYSTEQPIGKFTFGDLLERVNDNAPAPDIIGAVLSQSLDERRNEINDLANWVESLRKKPRT